MKVVLLFVLSLLMIACEKKPGSERSGPYAEKYRPQFHFSPPVQWTNDPNGLVYDDGEYHLFYQYNPYGDTWGHMSWGHAVSEDLIHWENLPVAIPEYVDPVNGDSTMVFSGTVVVDKNNSSGLCTGKACLVAVYTSHVFKGDQGIVQHQSLAYSNDRGRTWTRYAKNPILDIQRKDFRDPKVFWYEPQQKWVMILVIPDRHTARFYESKNLTEWNQLSEFTKMGDTTKIWECPDLFQVLIEDEPNGKKWVLSLSGNHPAGGPFVGMQYFVGEFDGTRFVPDDPSQPSLYVDHGKDFYAGIVVNNLDTPVMIGWANNWAYAKEIPTAPWRGAMSVPRQLSLKKTQEGLRLGQHPVVNLTTLRGQQLNLEKPLPGSAELEVSVDLSNREGLISLVEADGVSLISYDTRTSEIQIDRTSIGEFNFHKDFPGVDRAKLIPVDGKINLLILVDQSIIEIFSADGSLAMCVQYFSGDTELMLASAIASGASGWEMHSIWEKR